MEEKIEKNRGRFVAELELFINRRLLDKRLISEEMYKRAEEIILKKAV